MTDALSVTVAENSFIIIRSSLVTNFFVCIGFKESPRIAFNMKAKALY